MDGQLQHVTFINGALCKYQESIFGSLMFLKNQEICGVVYCSQTCNSLYITNMKSMMPQRINGSFHPLILLVHVPNCWLRMSQYGSWVQQNVCPPSKNPVYKCRFFQFIDLINLILIIEFWDFLSSTRT